MSNDEESHVFTAAESHLLNMFLSMLSAVEHGQSKNYRGAQQSLQECREHLSSLLEEWGMSSSAAKLDTRQGQGNPGIEEQIEQLRQSMPRDPSY